MLVIVHDVLASCEIFDHIVDSFDARCSAESYVGVLLTKCKLSCALPDCCTVQVSLCFNDSELTL